MIDPVAYAIAEPHNKQARFAHELFMLNLVLFNIMLTPVVIGLGIGVAGLLLIPALSGLMLSYFYLRAYRFYADLPWFALVHWRIAASRSWLLILGYALSACIIGLGWLLSHHGGPSPKIMLTVFTRIGVMPTVIVVFICLLLETSALEMASKGMIPEKWVTRLPPNEGAIL